MVGDRFCFLKSHIAATLIMVCCLIFSVGTAKAQTTSFTYQGRLTDGGNAANGTYDLQFALFDGGGLAIGSTLTRSGTTVSNGIFSVQLDFGVSAFPGADRFLEISVRPSGGGSFTILSPRQQISSTPYAIHTLSATTADALSSACVGCVQDTQISAVAGSKVTGTIPVASVPGGSGNYIQNTQSLQSASFNISGTGILGGPLSIGGTPISSLTVRTSGNAFGLTHTNGTTTLGSYVSSTGGWLGTITNHPLFFFTNNSQPQMTLSPNGNFGIGTTSPLQQLHVSSGSGNAAALVQTPTGAFAQYQLKSGAANSWIVGTQDDFANHALLFRNGSTDLMKINPDGNLSQPLSTNGLVKAMLLVNGDGSINLCYNSQLTGGGATTPSCGFSVVHQSNPAVYDITFPFQVNVRFFSASAAFDNGNTNANGLAAKIGVRPIAGQTIRVQTALQDGDPRDIAFYLIVY